MADYPDGIVPTSTTITIDEAGIAKDSSLQDILSQLDITLSALRDALRGSGNKSLTDVDGNLSNILGQLDIKLSEIKAGADQTPRTLSELYDQLSSIINQLDIALSSLRDSLLEGSPVYSQVIDADETTAQQVTLDKGGRKVLSIYAKATTATTFKVEFSNDNTHWFEYYISSSAETEYKSNVTTGHRYWRLSSDPAGGTADTVTLILSAV